jgi:hypothetical protein
MPKGILLPNERNLLLTQPALELSLASDGVPDVAKLLKVDEQIYGVTPGEAVNLSGPMLPHSALK